MGIGRKEPSPSPSIDHRTKNLLLLLPLTTQQRTFSFSFHWPPNKEPSPSPSIDHQALDLPSPSFSFSLKGKLGGLGLPFFSHRKQLLIKFLMVLVLTSFLRRKRMISLGSWEKEGEYNGNLMIVWKEWRWVVIVLGGWNLRKSSQTLLGFVA